MFAILKNTLLQPERVRKGLLPIEWLTVAYVAFTSILMLVFGSRMSDIGGMIALRAAALASVGVGFYCYKRMPSRFSLMLRVMFPMPITSLQGSNSRPSAASRRFCSLKYAHPRY